MSELDGIFQELEHEARVLNVSIALNLDEMEEWSSSATLDELKASERYFADNELFGKANFIKRKINNYAKE